MLVYCLIAIHMQTQKLKIMPYLITCKTRFPLLTHSTRSSLNRTKIEKFRTLDCIILLWKSMINININTVPLYHVPDCSSGPLLPNKTWRSSLPHQSSLSQVALMTFGTLNIQIAWVTEQQTTHVSNVLQWIWWTGFDVNTFDPCLPLSPILPGFPSGPFREKTTLRISLR